METSLGEASISTHSQCSVRTVCVREIFHPRSGVPVRCRSPKHNNWLIQSTPLHRDLPVTPATYARHISLLHLVTTFYLSSMLQARAPRAGDSDRPPIAAGLLQES